MKIDENFSRQYDKALRRATKRKTTYTKKTPSDLSRVSIEEIEPLEDYFYRRLSFLICPFTNGLPGDMKKSYIGHPLLSSRNLNERRFSFALYSSLDEFNHHIDKKK